MFMSFFYEQKRRRPVRYNYFNFTFELYKYMGCSVYGNDEKIYDILDS